MPKGKKILIIDREEASLRTYQRWLEAENYLVFPAMALDDGLNDVRAVQPDLILLDLKMLVNSKGNKCEKVIDEITKSDPEGKIVVMASDDVQQTAIEAIRMGVDDFLPKPVDPDVMLITIARTLYHRGIESELRRLKEDLWGDLLSEEIRQGEKQERRPLKEIMRRIEKTIILDTLKEHGGNRTRAARNLGITREGLHKKMTKYGIK